ncbi:MAG: YIP1 family protein [Bacteroidota bacterium]
MTDPILDHAYEPPEEDGVRLDNVAFAIWFRPRTSFRFILRHCPGRYILLLLLLAGLAQLVDEHMAMYQWWYDNYLLLLALLPLAVIISGPVIHYIFAWILQRTGRWINGPAKVMDLLAVLAWSSLPSIVSSTLLFAIILLSRVVDNGLYIGWMLDIHQYLSLLLTLWGLILIIIGISEAQRCSLLLALGNVIGLVFALFLPLALLHFGFGSFL